MTAGEVTALADLLQKVPPYVLGTALCLYVLRVWMSQGFLRLMEPVYFRRNRRRELLDSYVTAHGNDGTAPEMLSVISDMRDALYFYEATGIHEEKKWRDRLVRLHEQTSPSVSWRTIRYAKEYLRPVGTDGLVVPPFNWLEYLAMALTSLMGLLLVVLWIAYVYALLSDFQQIIVMWGAAKIANLVGIGLMLGAAFYVTIKLSLPYLAARKIRKELASPTP